LGWVFSLSCLFASYIPIYTPLCVSSLLPPPYIFDLSPSNLLFSFTHHEYHPYSSFCWSYLRETSVNLPLLSNPNLNGLQWPPDRCESVW
jgi:hypothetical protein